MITERIAVCAPCTGLDSRYDMPCSAAGWFPVVGTSCPLPADAHVSTHPIVSICRCLPPSHCANGLWVAGGQGSHNAGSDRCDRSSGEVPRRATPKPCDALDASCPGTRSSHSRPVSRPLSIPNNHRMHPPSTRTVPYGHRTINSRRCWSS